MKNINESFKATAESSKRRRKECSINVKEAQYPEFLESYKKEHDKALSKFCVYDYFVDKTYLYSQHKFISELKSMLKHPIQPAIEAFNKESFMSYWKINVENLLEEYSTFIE